MTSERTREELLDLVNRRIADGLSLGSTTELMSRADLRVGRHELLVFASIEEVHSILPELRPPPEFGRRTIDSSMFQLSWLKDRLLAAQQTADAIQNDNYLQGVLDLDYLADLVRGLTVAKADFFAIEGHLRSQGIFIEDLD